MSSSKWIFNNKANWARSNLETGSVVLTLSQVDELALSTNKVSAGSALFGDITKWCSSLIYYPIKLNTDGKEYTLRAAGIEYEDAHVLGYISIYYEYGFTMGEYYYPIATSYLDFEPYTKVELYLPYYGFTTLKVADIQGKYIQFRLYVDIPSGKAQYVVGVNLDSVEHGTHYPSCLGMDDTNTRVIGTYDFQLGANVPIGSSNFNEVALRTTLAVMTGAVSMGTSLASEALPSSRSTSTRTQVKTRRNKATGRQQTFSKMTDTKERETYSYDNYGRVNTAVDTASTVLSSMNRSTTGICSGDPTLNISLSNSIAIVKTKAMPTIDTQTDEQFKSLKGIPCGKTGIVGLYGGFNTFSDIRLEGDRFKTATLEELAMIEEAMSAGVIVPRSAG